MVGPDSSGHDPFKPASEQAADVVSDRRSGNRYRSVCRIARVTRADDVGLWQVKNISDKGMMLETSVAVGGSEDVEIALSEDTIILGRIVWADKGYCGVSFTESIDVEETLASLARQQRAEGYRALRMPVDAEAILVTPKNSHAIDLIDISKSGAGCRSTIPLEIGQEVSLLLPGEVHTRVALVRWANGLRGGLWFTCPLDRKSLESVARLNRRK